MVELDLRQAAWMALRKQHLTDETAGDGAVQIARDVGGLHATLAATPYLSLLARCPHFTRADLDDALYVSRRLVRLRCMRKTIHIVPTDMLQAAYAATKAEVQRDSWRYLAYRGVAPEVFERLSADILALIAGRELSAAEASLAVGPSIPLDALRRRGHPVTSHPVVGPRDPNDEARPFGCVSCHAPHGSDGPSLKRFGGDDPTSFCIRCHK